MSDLVRFGVSLEKDLLQIFDSFIQEKGFNNRSEALRALIKSSLIEQNWLEGEEVVGIITLVYDHHNTMLINRLKDLSHQNHHLIISTQHIHLDEENCLEVIISRGRALEIKRLGDNLTSTRGLMHSGFIHTSGKLTL